MILYGLLYRFGLASGSRIGKALQQNGSPEPIFDFDDTYSYFAVDLFVHESFTKSDNESLNDNISDLNGHALAILNILSEEPEITSSVLSKRLGISSRSIIKYTGDLKADGYIVRQGSNKSGKWVVKGSQ